MATGRETALLFSGRRWHLICTLLMLISCLRAQQAKSQTQEKLMQPTQILKNEHRVIEQVLASLQAITDQATRQGRLDGVSSRQALDFFRHFADGCHHGKEERHLFPLLESRGFSPSHGPTGVMRHEHEMGRHLLRGMAAEIEQAESGDADALKRFCLHAGTYIQLLRDHIFKEDHRLFPMAEEVLTDRDQDQLAESFAAVESKDMGPGTHEKYLAIANELADRFQVPRAVVQPAEHACCSHHG